MYLQKVKSNKQEKRIFFVGVLKVTDEKEQDPDLDPLVRGTDLRIRIKMSHIRNTGKKHVNAEYGRNF
jgi:hypothetical protein